MELKAAVKNSANKFVLTFEELDRAQENKTTSVLEVEDVFNPKRTIISHLIDSVDVKRYIESNVRTCTAYINDRADRAIFYKAAKFITTFHELPVNVKEVLYPGKPLILIEYGTLGVTDANIREFFDVLKEALYKRTEETEKLEEETEKTDSLEEVFGVKLEDESFPLGGIPGDFVEDDDDFDLGKVEETDD